MKYFYLKDGKEFAGRQSYHVYHFALMGLDGKPCMYAKTEDELEKRIQAHFLSGANDPLTCPRAYPGLTHEARKALAEKRYEKKLQDFNAMDFTGKIIEVYTK